MTKNRRLSDIPAEFEDVRAAHPQLADTEWSILLRYKPHPPASPHAWSVVRPFTIATAAAMLPDSFDEARRLMTMTARFHIWVWTRTGKHQSVEAVYTQNNIDRYLDAELKHRSHPHRYGTSRQLVHVGQQLADAALTTIAAPGHGVRQPYTTKQIASMHSWANSLTTLRKRQNAQALLGLAGGAGLRSEEIVDARVPDVTVDGDHTFVTVHGARARRVPVRHAWARVLLRSIEGREDTDEHLFRGFRHAEYPPRVIQHFLTEHPAMVRPTPAALRTGWVLHHIDNNVPPLVLMEAAGIDHVQSLLRYYENAARPNVADFTALLTGTGAMR